MTSMVVLVDLPPDDLVTHPVNAQDISMSKYTRTEQAETTNTNQPT
jgi:hypothetical protein